MEHTTVNKHSNAAYAWGFKSVSFWLASLIAIGIIYIVGAWLYWQSTR